MITVYKCKIVRFYKDEGDAAISYYVKDMMMHGYAATQTNHYDDYIEIKFERGNEEEFFHVKLGEKQNIDIPLLL